MAPEHTLGHGLPYHREEDLFNCSEVGTADDHLGHVGYVNGADQSGRHPVGPPYEQAPYGRDIRSRRYRLYGGKVTVLTCIAHQSGGRRLRLEAPSPPAGAGVAAVVDDDVADLGRVPGAPAVCLAAEDKATPYAQTPIAVKKGAMSGRHLPLHPEGGGGRGVVNQHREPHRLLQEAHDGDFLPAREVRRTDDCPVGQVYRTGDGDT